MKTTNRFAKGSGVYKCRCCGRPTRSTGRGDNEHNRTCAECYDLGGVENMISDNGATPELLVEKSRLESAIIAKGGKVA